MAKPTHIEKKLKCCSFCEKNQHEVDRLYAAPDDKSYICNECVDLIATEELGSMDNTNKVNLGILTPEEIVGKLDQYVIGQDIAKKTLAVAAYHHYRRVGHRGKDNQGVEVLKSNILLLGPTGSGKTYLVESLAKILGVPYAKLDLMTVSTAGYVGKDVEDVFRALLKNAKGDVARAEFGLVFCDEVDKLSPRSGPDKSQGFGVGIQNTLLTVAENADVEVESDKKNSKEVVAMNTKNMLFVFAGAFEGLEKITAKNQPNSCGSIGFNAKRVGQMSATSALFREVTTEDLVEFGMESQFIGRLSSRAALDELNQDMLVKILTEPKNALMKQISAKLAWDGVQSEFDKDAVLEIARRAIKLKLGARGLQSICDEIYQPIFYALPSLQKKNPKVTKVHLRAEHVLSKTSPELITVPLLSEKK